ncbi:hypothetical protein [Catellatospora sp. TT07R-123]|uniref:hypothetical protein n=1 Tax=Catellatospora sp. TT07R-123 TaxID=2733863 RepID=UPI001BB31627|nr:hypothetical protein [Catellatospora sp. TT07R-123]
MSEQERGAAQQPVFVCMDCYGAGKRVEHRLISTPTGTTTRALWITCTCHPHPGQVATGP